MPSISEIRTGIDGNQTIEYDDGTTKTVVPVRFDVTSGQIEDILTQRAVRGAIHLTIETPAGQDASTEVLAKLSTLKSLGGGVLRFPFNGQGHRVSQKILVDFDNCTVILEDDLLYTGTAVIDAVIHFKGAISPARYINRPALIAPRKVKIDGNGRNLTSYVHPNPGQPGTMFCVWFQFCKDIFLSNIYAYNGISGGIIGSYCLGGKVINPEASDVYYDNGIYFYNNGEHYGLPSMSDPSTWANIDVYNAKAWNCANHGVGIYGAIAVNYFNPEIWNCGNNAPTGLDSNPRAAGPAGGIGIEFDSNTDPSAALDYRCVVYNPKVVGSFGFGIRTNCKGTKVHGGFVKGTKIPTNYTDSSPALWGSGVFVQNNAEADITCDLIDNERHGARIQGATIGSQFPSFTFDGVIKGSGYEAVQAVGVTLLRISPTSRLSNNGKNGPLALTTGYPTLSVNNIAGYNQNAGICSISGRFDDNGGLVAQINSLGFLDLKDITGNGNCSSMTAAAKHAIYVSTASVITARGIMLTGTFQTRVLKVDASTKAIIERSSILGDQTNNALPRADVVSTTLIADIYSNVAPSVAPSYQGQQWIDTVLNKVYLAKSSTSSSDWIALN